MIPTSETQDSTVEPQDVRRALFWRNVLLAAVLVTFVRALAAGFAPWRALHSPRERMIVFLLIGGAFCCALGVREFASLLFKSGDVPWYGQRGGIFFLFFMSMAIHTIWVAGYGVAAPHLKVESPYADPALVHATIALQVLFVVLLDWMPSVPRDGRGSARRKKPGALKTLLRWLASDQHGGDC